MDPVDGLRSVRKRLSDPVDALAQAVAERVIDLVLRAVDINAVLERVDLNTLLERVDVNRLLERVDVNSIASRVDIDALAEQTDIGAVIARSSGTVASDVLDVVRSQAFGLDELVARVVAKLLRRGYAGPPGPPPLLRSGPPPVAAP